MSAEGSFVRDEVQRSWFQGWVGSGLDDLLMIGPDCGRIVTGELSNPNNSYSTIGIGRYSRVPYVYVYPRGRSSSNWWADHLLYSSEKAKLMEIGKLRWKWGQMKGFPPGLYFERFPFRSVCVLMYQWLLLFDSEVFWVWVVCSIRCSIQWW